MKKGLSLLFASIVLLLFAIGCSKDSPQVDKNDNNLCSSFTLTASYDTDETRATFDPDGLGATWQPDDCLYLIDVAGKNSTVKLTTTITEPSKTATFKASGSVLSGTYLVLNGTSSTTIKYPAMTVNTLEGLSPSLLFYGTLTVEDGQTSASIRLKQAYSKLTFKFQNVPTGIGTISIGMAVSEVGFLNKTVGKITEDGFVTKSSSYQLMHSLGTITSSTTSGAVLIEPIDFTGKKVFFYAYGSSSSFSPIICYEYIKDGIDIQAGKNYNITLDFNNPTNKSTLEKSGNYYLIGTPAQFRAAAYVGSNDSPSVKVMADVDFTNEQYFPIYANTVQGEDHTISNVSMDFNELSNIALFKGSIYHVKAENLNIKGANYTAGICASGTVSSCTLTNATISGEGYVGGITGSGAASSCSLAGVISVTGSSEYVGGITGTGSPSDCNATGELTVSGRDYVGGFTGSANSMTNCLSDTKANITGWQYVGGLVGNLYGAATSNSIKNDQTITGQTCTGGIAGYAYNISMESCGVLGKCVINGNSKTGGIAGHCSSISKSIVKGDITVNGNENTGGIAGQQQGGKILECGFEGNVIATGINTGGIVGDMTSGNVDKCYVKGNVSGTTNLGGIGGVGGFSSDDTIKNSYIIGDVTSSSYTTVGGISGSCYYAKYCYSYGNVSSGYGIAESLYDYNHNLCSMSKMYNGNNGSAYCNCSASKTYLSLIDVINVEEAYSTQTWPNIDAKCPLLQWQSQDFGGDITIPGFDDNDW